MASEAGTGSTVEAVIAELNSEYGSLSRAVGPLKSLNEMTLTDVFTDITCGDVGGRIRISAYHETPHAESFTDARSFDVTLADVKMLAGTAPRWRDGFVKAAQDMSDRLQQERTANTTAISNWCDEGLPTKTAMRIMSPLRWKR